MNNKAYSLIEMLIVTAIVGIVLSSAYEVLTKQTRAQQQNVSLSKLNNEGLNALARFKKDVSLIDPTWLKFGVISVYPLQNSVLFLQRDPNKGKFNSLAQNFSYNTLITLNEPTEISEQDWVLLYEAGKSSVGVVTEVQASAIKVRALNASESHGVISTTLLVSKKARVQVVKPVVYELDAATSNGQPHDMSNVYLLDTQGLKRMMIVRTSDRREYLAQAPFLAITYDVLQSDYGSLYGGTESGQIDQDTTTVSNRARIVALHMQIGNNQTKVALDPNLQNDRYQKSAKIHSSLTANLRTDIEVQLDSLRNLLETMYRYLQYTDPFHTHMYDPPLLPDYANQIGKPLYLTNDNGDEVMVPLSSFLTSGESIMYSAGELIVYDTQGCAVNSVNCQPSVNSRVQFNPSGTGTFLPNTTAKVTDENGTRIIVGGISMSGNDANATRVPGIGIIHLNANETLKDKLNAPVTGTSCNIENCEWHAIDTTSLPGLVDTANIAIDETDANAIYIATMTKTDQSAQSKVFKGVWDGSDYQYSEVTSVAGTEDDKVVSAIGDQTLLVNHNHYLPVCLSKSTNTANSTGEIQLINVVSGDSIHLIDHNYRCSSLNIDKDHNLIVGGRLTVQPISFAEITKVVNGTPLSKSLYLDEITGTQGIDNVYADYFQVEPKTYSGASQQYIGWLTGLSTVSFADHSFGMVNANKFRLSRYYGENRSNKDKDYQNVGVFQGELGGISARVVATIQTNFTNLNASSVSSMYSSDVSLLPAIYIPGKFYNRKDYNGNYRTTPTPLPAMSPSMSEASWLRLYQQMITPHGETSLDSDMPSFGYGMEAVTNCTTTKPQTC